MAGAIIDREILARELRCVDHVDVETFIEVLRRSVHSAVAVPADARDIMIRAGVDPDLLDPDKIEDARVQIAGAIALGEP